MRSRAPRATRYALVDNRAAPSSRPSTMAVQPKKAAERAIEPRITSYNVCYTKLLRVIANLRFLAAAGKLYEVRTVVVPGSFDAERTVREVSRALVDSGSAARYKLIRFRPQGVRARWRGLPVPDDDTMAALAALARAEGVREVVVV